MGRWASVLALAAVLGMTAGIARAQVMEGDQKAAEETWNRTDGRFGAMLIVTDRFAELARGWSEPSASEDGPSITLTDTAARGDEVTAALTFSGCTPGIVGKCQCNADFTVLKPDGSTYSTHKRVPVWSAAPPPSESVQLANGRLRFRVEANDPLGTYRIRAVVRDLVSKSEVTLEWPIAVKAETWSPGQRSDWPMPASFADPIPATDRAQGI